MGERVPSLRWTGNLQRPHHLSVGSAGEEAQTSPKLSQFLDSGPADKDAFFAFDSFHEPLVDLAQRRRIQNRISQRNYRKYHHYMHWELET